MRKAELANKIYKVSAYHFYVSPFSSRPNYTQLIKKAMQDQEKLHCIMIINDFSCAKSKYTFIHLNYLLKGFEFHVLVNCDYSVLSLDLQSRNYVVC